MEQWKTVIWSNESCFALFPTSVRVYVWQTPSWAYDAICLFRRVKHSRSYVMVWTAISWYSMSVLVVLKGRITRKNHVIILADHFHPIIQYLIPNVDAIFQYDNALIHTQDSTGLFYEHEMVSVTSPIAPYGQQIKILLSLFGLFSKKKCVITINLHLHHRYLKLSLFYWKNGTKFPW